jgi:hypothetical protein
MTLLLLLLQVEVPLVVIVVGGVQAGVVIAPPLLEQVLVVVKVAWLYVVGVTINSEMGEYEGDQVLLLLLPALRLTTLTTLLLSVV